MRQEQFFNQLEQLVANAKGFLHSGFGSVDPEEATKQHLIEPLLESLGYTRDDFDKEFHILGGQVDYLLKHNRPLMFLEAKSLLDRRPRLFEAHQDQVLEYIRSYRVSPEQVQMAQPVTWILLTNFAQFHFIRVNEEAPSFSFTLNELVARRDELWQLLALESVEAGRIDELYDQQHKDDLDQRFLADLKHWRLILANGFAMRNPRASCETLTKASQQLLDRFLFCRMLETNRLIEYNRLARLYANYPEMYGDPPTRPFASVLRESLFSQIKRDFNTELFEQPQLCDEFDIGNEELAIVIGHAALSSDIAAQCGIEQGQGELFSFRHLYRYDFSRMSGDIMGAVYERFLAHKLAKRDNRIVIEDTDEIRKKEGIYYTPRYIVDYIIENTVRNKVRPVVAEALALLGYRNYKGAHAKIRELAQVKVLDAAMGSGSFLLRAFGAFVEAYETYNAECRKLRNERNTSGLLFDAPQDIAVEVDHLGMRVATENIFGVDLDQQAVEVARLNLWIRLMVAERDHILEMLRIRSHNGQKPLNLLPPLANNLKCGNSLIDDPVVAGETAFNWQEQFPDVMKRGGFDCVIGNPPYERIQTMTGSAPNLVEYLKAKYKSAAAGNFDIYVCFVERGLDLLAPAGSFGYICPNKFFEAEYGKCLRKLLAEGKHVRGIVSFGHQLVFPEASTYTCLLFLSKGEAASAGFERVDDLKSWQTGRPGHPGTFQAAHFTDGKWNFALGADATLLQRLSAVRVKLSDVTDRIFQGLKTAADGIFILESIEQHSRGVRVFSPETQREYWLEPSLLHTLVKGGDTSRYALSETKRLILFPYVPNKAGAMQLIPAAQLQKEFPQTWEYLLANKQRLEDREDGKMKGDNWYGYGRIQALDVIHLPKIFTPDLSPCAAYSLDETGTRFFTGGVAGGYGILVKPEISREFILGLLNSRLLEWFVQHTSTAMRGGWFSFEARFIRNVPIKLVDPKNTREKKLEQDIVECVNSILARSRQRSQLPQVIAAEIAHTNRTNCSLAHYVQKDYTNAVRSENLIDFQREGFVRRVTIQSEKNEITVGAEVSDVKNAVPVAQPVVRLLFANPTLQQFIYASLRSFLDANAAKKVWTVGKTPQPIHHLIVHDLEPLVVFQPDAGDNLRIIRDLMSSVAQEVGTSDLASIEHEIDETDKAIDQLVYQLYDLSPEEIALVARGDATRVSPAI